MQASLDIGLASSPLLTMGRWRIAALVDDSLRGGKAGTGIEPRCEAGCCEGVAPGVPLPQGAVVELPRLGLVQLHFEPPPAHMIRPAACDPKGIPEIPDRCLAFFGPGTLRTRFLVPENEGFRLGDHLGQQ